MLKFVLTVESNVEEFTGHPLNILELFTVDYIL